LIPHQELRLLVLLILNMELEPYKYYKSVKKEPIIRFEIGFKIEFN